MKERFDPNDDSFAEQTRKHHMKRYQLASLFPSLSTLDLCSGHGYGTALLQKHWPQATVIGAEIDANVVEQAKAEYKPAFFCCDISDPDAVIWEGSYSLITFFEAIEHLPFDKGVDALHYASASLNYGGILIVSTPRDIKEDENHYHISEWSLPILEDQLRPLFSSVRILAQSWDTGEIGELGEVKDDFYICICTK